MYAYHRAGKLAKSTILNGFAALKVSSIYLADLAVVANLFQSLSEVLNDSAGAVATEYGSVHDAVSDLTNRYYS